MYESDDKMVSHPAHYQSETGLEVIDAIEAFTFDLKGIEATDTGNVIKYICRWKNKNGVQDLKKAMWYLQHLINHVELLEEENNQGRTRYSYDDIFFDTREEAEEVLSKMDELIELYGVVRVADLYELVGITRDYTDNKYGWKNIRNARIERTRDGYAIKLPRALLID